MRTGVLILLLLGACAAPWPLDDRPCPCAAGYACCLPAKTCLPVSQTCPALPPEPSRQGSDGGAVIPDAPGDPVVVEAPADAPVTVIMDAAAPDVPNLPNIADGGAAAPDRGPEVELETGPWTMLPAVADLVPRSGHTAVWTGEELIVWGGVNGRGVLRSGGRFNPKTGGWRATTLEGAPDARRGHTAVWTGQEMLVWGGDLGDERDFPVTSGGRYDPRADRWLPLENPQDPQRTLHSAVWTGEEMLVWGGKLPAESDGTWNGARYHPVRGWSPLSRTNEPSELTYAHTAVWGGGKMIVFGGFGVKRVGYVGVPGALYDPKQDAWVAMSTEGAPGGRGQHTAVWTGREMIVWGGLYISGRVPQMVRDNGARFDPVTNRWSPMASAGAGGPRYLHTAVWASGSTPGRGRLIVWGGLAQRLGDASASLGTGAAYDPETDRWDLLPAAGAPTARCQHIAVWTGGEMLLWGGADVHAMDLVYRADGARLTP